MACPFLLVVAWGADFGGAGHGICDLAHARGGRALGDVERQQRERVLLARGLDGPPDRVPAGAARGERRPVAKRASVPFEGGEDDAALVRLVVVVEQVVGHADDPAAPRPRDIGEPP